MIPKIQSRELRFVPPCPSGKPLLLVETERAREPVARVFQFFHIVGNWIGRTLRGERSHKGGGSIAFHASSLHIERDPVRDLGEWRSQEFDLAYDDVTRLEYVAPDTVILGFGLVTRGLNQQVALSLTPLEAQDKFDSIVEHFESRGSSHLYSILDNGTLTHSRPWTWEERFPDFGLTDEVTVQLLEAGRIWRWSIVTREEEAFDVVESHGLVLSAALDPERGLMQAFTSQIVDGTGLSLAVVERRGASFGIHTSRDERFWIDADGDVRLGEEIVGSFPLDRDPTTGPDTLSTVFGSAPRIVSDSHVSKCLSLTRPLPKAWVLALVLITLLPRHVAEAERGR